MRILLLSHYFPPEIGSGPHLPYELGESLAAAGHDITVVTNFPRYNVDEMPHAYRRRLLVSESNGGMRILRVNAPNFYGSSVLSRGLVQMLAPPVLGARAMAAPKPDVVYTVTPPIMMGLTARRVAGRFGVPWVANVQDLFPQCMIDLGILRGRRMIGLFERMERTVYRTASAITVMSEGNRRFVIGRGGDPDRVHVVPNWVDTDAIAPGERANPFREAHGLGDDFVVTFAGTMGFSQGLDHVVAAAARTSDVRGLRWLFVGGGAEHDRLASAAAGLPNVTFLPMQSRDVYPQVLAASDACLVTLRPEVATPTVPSKIGTIMAAGRPILASLPATGDARALIEESGAGLLLPPGDPEALAGAAQSLMADPERVRQMGLCGRAYAVGRLSREGCVRLAEAALARVIEERERDRHGR